MKCMSIIERKSNSADDSLRWNEEESEYKIQESSVTKVNTLDEYVFVMCMQSGKW